MAYTPYIQNHILHLDGLGLDSPTITAINNAISVINGLLNNKQDILVSGTNIKTINGQSLLGTGDIEIEGGGSGGTSYSYLVENPEYIYCLLDSENKVLWGLREDGTEVSSVDDIDNASSSPTNILNLNPNVEYILAKLHHRSYRENSTTNDVVSFLWFSDLHGNGTNLQRIREFYNQYSRYFDGVISTGDQIAEKVSDDWSFWNFEECIFSLGNHEVWKAFSTKESDPATQKQCYDKYYGNIPLWDVVQPANAATNGYCYFYKDYISKFRLIVLDQLHWDSTQATWFDGVLSSAKSSNLTVIVMGHYACGIHDNFHYNTDCGFTTIELFGLGNSTNQGVQDGWIEQETILKDWIDGGGKFSVWLCGHTHNDYFGTSDKGVPCIVIEQATNLRSYSDCRTESTKSQDSFNLLSIDATNQKIYIARIGNDVDKMMRSKRFLCYDYSNKQVINFA